LCDRPKERLWRRFLIPQDLHRSREGETGDVFGQNGHAKRHARTQKTINKTVSRDKRGKEGVQRRTPSRGLVAGDLGENSRWRNERRTRNRRNRLRELQRKLRWEAGRSPYSSNDKGIFAGKRKLKLSGEAKKDRIYLCERPANLSCKLRCLGRRRERQEKFRSGEPLKKSRYLHLEQQGRSFCPENRYGIRRTPSNLKLLERG